MRTRISNAYDLFHRCRQALAALAAPVPPVPAHVSARGVHKVLQVCVGLMGDTLMSLPAMSCARALFPGAEVVGLVAESGRALLELSHCFDRFIIADGSPLSLRPGRRREAAALEARLIRESFDLAVIFLGDDYAPMLTRARIPCRVFVRETPYRRLATRSYRIGHPRTWGPQERFEAWRALGLEPRPGSVTLTPPAAAVNAVDARLRPLPRPVVLLHPFGRTPEQWWPEPAWTALASLIRQEMRGTAILIGASSASAPPEGSTGLEVMGLLPMPDLVALFLKADCVVSTDSGPFHLAGTMDRPGVGLFRASRSEHSRRYANIEPIVGSRDPACSRHCSWTHCRTLPCAQMAGTTAATVLEAVKRKLEVTGHVQRG